MVQAGPLQFMRSDLAEIVVEIVRNGYNKSTKKGRGNMSITATELKNISYAFKNLSNQLLSTSEYQPYNSKTCSSALFDMVTSRVCSECPDSKICWRENLNDTCKQLFMIIDEMEEKGYCDMTNIPIVFL